MCRLSFCIVVLLLPSTLSAPKAWGQLGGSRAGIGSDTETVPTLPILDRDVVESYISIDGRAEVRVRPTEIRIVLAVTSEGQTAKECQIAIADTIRQLKTSWLGLGVPEESIVEDFIAVLPMYEWVVEKHDSGDIGVEKNAGYRMQSNVHLAVPNDAHVIAAVEAAFEIGVTDIIAFDYWSRELDEARLRARELAVKAARSKADLLFSTLFDAPPRVINVQEQTTTHYPESLYDSFVNAYDEEVTGAWRRDIPFIRAHRPRNTYYRGFYFDGDVQARELPMEPEISVVSVVRVYYESGTAKRMKETSVRDNN